MIKVKEHFYDDDPNQGHPDCRTRLRDAFYFFLGNGLISAAVQVSPAGEGSPMGLLVMDPDKLGKKRDALSFDPETGLENTMIEFSVNGKHYETPAGSKIISSWEEVSFIPAVVLSWKKSKIEVTEQFFCPDLHRAALARIIKVRNLTNQKLDSIQIRTGLLGYTIEDTLNLAKEEAKELFFVYELDRIKNQVSVKQVPSVHIDPGASEYWGKKTRAEFKHTLLDHYFVSSRNQLAAVISRSGTADAGIWQYNREWVRDHSMIVMGLLLTGHHKQARVMLHRLITDFVSHEGGTVDSSERRHPDEIELDQNGELLWVLWNYILWTNDLSLAKDHWDKIEKIAEFPLGDIFRHSPSGLLMNRRDYWERHRIHGIEPGLELAHQFFVSVGLKAAAAIARVLLKNSKAEEWIKEAERLKNVMLHNEKYGLIQNNVLIKRRGPDGKVQGKIHPLLSADLPPGLPLTSPGDHFLNPDTSVVLPIAMNFISPDSELAKNTLESCEELWEQVWEGGGYGRYHYASEADSAGSWPFPSLFVARAWTEAGCQDKVLRILEWLNTIPGSVSGAWFEFYGKRLAPPYPQVGVTPWTWSEMLMLLINHFAGLRLQESSILIKPFFLPGVDVMQLKLLIRKQYVSLKLEKRHPLYSEKFHTDGTVIQASSREIELAYPDKNIDLHAYFY